MAKTSSSWMLTVNLADETKLLALRTVLNYESVVRGLSVSQTIIEMVLEAADVSSYPEEVRSEIDGIRKCRSARAAVRAAEAAELARIA